MRNSATHSMVHVTFASCGFRQDVRLGHRPSGRVRAKFTEGPGRSREVPGVTDRQVGGRYFGLQGASVNKAKIICAGLRSSEPREPSRALESLEPREPSSSLAFRSAVPRPGPLDLRVQKREHLPGRTRTRTRRTRRTRREKRDRSEPAPAGS